MTLRFEFIRHLLDRSAQRKEAAHWTRDVWFVVVPAAAAASAQLDAVGKLGTGLLSAPAPLLEVVTLLLFLASCVFVISAREAGTAVAPRIVLSDIPARPSMVYRFGPLTRGIAKLGLLVVPLALPAKAVALYDVWVALPEQFEGHVFDSRTGGPLPDARFRVVTREGADITAGSWVSDSDGFFVVRARPAPHRRDQLVVSHAGCKDHSVFQLTRGLQSEGTDRVPHYRLTFDCKEKR